MKPALRNDRRSGQAIIFLMVVMVIGLFVVLWNYDLHNIVSTKIRVGNAGDAGALAAARWQGITMNMIGELNLIQAAVLLQNPFDPANTNTVEMLSELRTRISLNGPLMGFVAAQGAAYMNLQEKDMDRVGTSYDTQLASRAAEFQASAGGLYRGLIEGAYEDAWMEYGNMLASIAQSDMVIGCANTRFYFFYNGSHILLDPYFYHAVASSYWCWFADNHRDLLTDYSDYNSWPSLPPVDTRPPINSEYFSTDMKRVDTLFTNMLDFGVEMDAVQLNNQASADEFRERFKSYMATEPNIEAGGNYDPFNMDVVLNQNFSWHFYNDQSYDSWNNNGWPEGPFRDGITVKPEFNYRGGANAAVDVYLQAFNITPGMHIDNDDIRWMAAAKPFGWLEVDDGRTKRQKPHYFGVVLPAFHQARLIPNDISTRQHGATEPGWDDHAYEHLLDYMSGGPSAIEGNGCYYCKQLVRWENPDFRAAGDIWLQDNHENPNGPDRCYDPRGRFDTGSAGDWR